jgi:hypothetical protein
MHVLFDTVDVVCTVDVCALGRDAEQVTLFHLFDVMNANVCEQNCWFEIFCHLLCGVMGTFASSTIGHTRLPVLVQYLICCRNLTRWFTHSGKHVD